MVSKTNFEGLNPIRSTDPHFQPKFYFFYFLNETVFFPSFCCPNRVQWPLSCQSTLPRAFRIRSAGQPDINYIKYYTVSLTSQTEPISSCPTIMSAFFSPVTAWSKTYSEGLTKHSHARLYRKFFLHFFFHTQYKLHNECEPNQLSPPPLNHQPFQTILDKFTYTEFSLVWSSISKQNTSFDKTGTRIVF